VTFTLVIGASEFEYSTRILDHLKESVSDIHQPSFRKFPSFTQDKEHIEKFEGKVNEVMSSFHVCNIVIFLIGS
jgi:hypothetical protein